jgi:hypothetical protein
MRQNLISQTMTNEQLKALLDDLKAFKTKFEGFRCLLTPTQIRHLSKLDSADIGLLEIAQSHAQQNPGSLPADIDITELNKDIALVRQLAQVEVMAEQVSDLVRCSLIATMSDTFAAARQMYRVEKAKGQTPTNAAFLEAFGHHFGRGPQPPVTPPPAP